MRNRSVPPRPGWVRRALDCWASTDTYGADEVLQRLRSGGPADARTAAVQAAASQTAAWSALLSETTALDLGLATATRLPRVIFWYRRGVDFADIGRRLSPFGDAWDGERAVMVACGLIARLLNRTRPQSSANTTWPRRHTESP